jgi:hypothetical protein
MGLDQSYPKTADEFMDLPVGGGFGARTIEVDGVNVVVPVLPTPSAVWTPDDGIQSAYDEDGRLWRIGKSEDGYFRRAS